MSTSVFFTPLPDLAVIEISGADAASFLHGQLSHDMSSLTPGQARLAGYCTAKGRLLGSMVVWSATGTEVPVLRALIKADIAESIVKRLSMFVLRAKVKLGVTSIRVLGLSLAHHSDLNPGGAISVQAGVALAEHAASLPDNPLPFTVVHTDAGDWIAAPRPPGGALRWWLVASNAIDFEEVSDTSGAEWQAADIAAGLPWVQAATQETFIPQTLNLDLIDGVSFTKGCYPGQEVVARSHYRGTVKRRMAYGVIKNSSNIDATGLPGTDTFDARQPENPAGRIVNAAHAPGQHDDSANVGPIHVLMEVQLTDLPDAQFCLGGANGAAIELRPLPYSIEAS